MKRVLAVLLSAVLVLGLCACAAEETEQQNMPSPAVEAVAETPAEASGVSGAEEPIGLELPAAAEGWQGAYLAFLDDNYDIFAAIWQGGMSGVGFIDLDLDGTPEMAVFDLGASATLGVQLFDLVDGQVYCVSSVAESAVGAFDPEYFSTVSVCTSYFDSFRLLRGADGYCFWVESANGSLETAWSEIVRFDSVNGVLTPVSVCSRYMECNAETGEIISETYSVGTESTDADGYAHAASVYTEGQDAGYEASGLFVWNNMKRYDTSYEGFMAMAEDATTAYVPVAVS